MRYWGKQAGKQKEACSIEEASQSPNLVVVFVLQAADIELASPCSCQDLSLSRAIFPFLRPKQRQGGGAHSAWAST